MDACSTSRTSSGVPDCFSWLDLPVFGPNGDPQHERGVVTSQPGLYFVGLHFLYAFSSTMIHGVGRDAERIASHAAARARSSEQPGLAAVSAA
jgi:putative flavoprotein involved in K+ transport